MTDKAELLALAERCEQATGPDREIELAIEDAIKGPVKPPYRRGFCPAYTASLDAAMSLVPDTAQNVELDAMHCWSSGPFLALVTDWDGERHEGEAPSFAAALTAACLRALASESSQ